MVAAIAAAIWYSQQQGQVKDPVAKPLESSVVLQQVSVMSVSQSDSAVMPQRYTATVVARRTSQLAFQAAERVDRILCGEGDYVTKGQLLAQQDQAALKAQFDAAVARSKQTTAVLAELEKGPRQETIEAARAELSQLKARSQGALADYRRQIALRKSRASSASEYDAAKFEAEASKSAAIAAEQRLSELLAGTREEQIDAQRGALGVITATVAQAKTRLEQTNLYAPFSGRISRRFVDEGSLPQRGTAVLEIVESDHLEVRFGVSPEIARELQPGDSLSFTSGSATAAGKLKQVQPKLNRSTRTQMIIATLSESEKSGLVDGQMVTVEFAIASKMPGFWIPTEALQPQLRGLWSVLIAESDGDSGQAIAKRRDVEVLATWGRWSRVRGTLEESEKVIVEGAARISSGQRIAISESDLELPWQQQSVVKLGELSQEPVQ